MSEIQGLDIKEVWDYRLSTAVPTIYNQGKTWVVAIHSKGESNDPLETHDTGVSTEKGDTYDTDKVKVCFEWLKSVRDKYSLPDIEERKPLVAKINRLHAEANKMERGLTASEAKIKHAELKVWDEAMQKMIGDAMQKRQL